MNLAKTFFFSLLLLNCNFSPPEKYALQEENSQDDCKKCQQLDSLSIALRKQGIIDSSMIINDQLFIKAQEKKDSNYIALALARLGMHRRVEDKKNEADSLLQLALTFKPKNKTRLDVYHALSLTSVDLGKYDKALSYLEKTKEVNKGQLNDSYLSTYYQYKAYIHSTSEKDNAKVFPALFNAFKYSEKDNEIKSEILYQIAEQYKLINACEISINYLHMGLTFTSNKVVESSFSMALAENFIQMENVDSAKYYLDKYEVLENTHKTKVSPILFQLLKSDLYLLNNQITLSLTEAKKALHNAKKNKDISSIAYAYIRLAQIKSKQKKYGKSLKYYQFIEDMNGNYLSYNDYKNRAEIYAINKQWELAYSDFKKYNNKYNQVIDKNDLIQLNEQLLTHQNDLEQREINLLTKKKEIILAAKVTKQNYQLSIMLGIIASAGFIIFILYQSNIKRKKKNIIINNQKEELKKMNQHSNKLFYILGHDLRSPITGIDILFQQLLSKNISTEDFLNILPSIKQSVSNINLTINNVLNWGLFQDNKFHKIRDQEINIAQEIDHIKSLYLNLLIIKKIKFENKIARHLTLTIDNDKFNLIIRNIISNSIKYTNEEGCIIIDSTYSEKGIIIEIKDNGIGIPFEKLNHIFENPKSTRGTHNEKGTGLGLNLCKQMINFLEGNIHMKSTKGKGTSTFIELPLH